MRGRNLVAAGALLLVLSGGLIWSDLPARAQYVVDHALLWRLGWGVWIAAALTLVAFYGWWGSRIASSTVAIIA